MSRYCVVALQHILCDNSSGSKQGKEGGYEGFAQRGVGTDRTQHVCGIYIFTGVHIHVYMQVCPCACDWARQLPEKWMCWPHQRVSSWWRCFGNGALAAARSGGSLHLCCLGTGLQLWWMEVNGGEMGGWVDGGYWGV